MTTENLWGHIDIGIAPPSPVVTLQKQASKLEEITGGLLSANIQKSQDGHRFHATLEIVAPYLYNYRRAVVEIRYPPEVFPIQVLDLINGSPFSTDCKDEDQFISETCRYTARSKNAENLGRTHLT